MDLQVWMAAAGAHILLYASAALRVTSRGTPSAWKRQALHWVSITTTSPQKR
jgi:hypothetical protein